MILFGLGPLPSYFAVANQPESDFNRRLCLNGWMFLIGPSLNFQAGTYPSSAARESEEI